jgi:hypothetical protein
VVDVDTVVGGGGGAGFFARLLISSESRSFWFACFSFVFNAVEAILFSLLS